MCAAGCGGQEREEGKGRGGEGVNEGADEGTVR